MARPCACATMAIRISACAVPGVAAGLMTFDLLGLDGSYLVSLPLHARRAQLAALIDGQGDGLLFSGHVAGSQARPCFGTPAPWAWKGSCPRKPRAVIGLARDRNGSRSIVRRTHADLRPRPGPSNAMQSSFWDFDPANGLP